LNSPQLRSTLWLVAVALAALAVSLLLAFAAATAPRPDANGDGARRTTATAGTPIASHENNVGDAAGNGPSRPLPSLVDRPRPLWTLLAPWAFAVDAIAVLGLAAVLIVRYHARRRRGARM
jgi:membrane protein implicated in regulation of membrane protease activity